MKAYIAIYDNLIRENAFFGNMFSAIAEEFDVGYIVTMTEECYGIEIV